MYIVEQDLGSPKSSSGTGMSLSQGRLLLNIGFTLIVPFIYPVARIVPPSLKDSALMSISGALGGDSPSIFAGVVLLAEQSMILAASLRLIPVFQV